MESPELAYESITCIRIKLEDNPTCNIGIYFDLVADKIGELNQVLFHACPLALSCDVHSFIRTSNLGLRLHVLRLLLLFFYLGDLSEKTFSTCS